MSASGPTTRGVFGECLPEDLPGIAELVNAAYRGEDGKAGWTHELDVVEGLRTHVGLLRQELAESPAARILTLRSARVEGDGSRTPLLACVKVELNVNGSDKPACYISMLAVRPGLQGSGVGRLMLAFAESEGLRQGARVARLTVLSVRNTLIQWYERRGYLLTGERQAFPYEDQRFGRPLRTDLDFVVLERDLSSDPA